MYGVVITADSYTSRFGEVSIYARNHATLPAERKRTRHSTSCASCIYADPFSLTGLMGIPRSMNNSLIERYMISPSGSEP